MDISIHLWWGVALGAGAAATIMRHSVLTMRLDDASGRDVPGAAVHDVGLLAALISAGVRVGVVVDFLEHPLGILE
jgi:hypothetical protein